MNKADYHSAHRYSSGHRNQVLDSELCGCFYCLTTYPPTDIEQWIHEDDSGLGQTALCPNCGIDSVIGSNAGVPLTHDFLVGMRRLWFEIN